MGGRRVGKRSVAWEGMPMLASKAAVVVVMAAAAAWEWDGGKGEMPALPPPSPRLATWCDFTRCSAQRPGL